MIGGGAAGTQVTLRGDTFSEMRTPIDGNFITTAGGQPTVLDGNEFFTAQYGVNNDFVSNQVPGGVIRAGAAGSVEGRGNFWSTICNDPYSFVPTVNTSGDMCARSDGDAQHIPAYSRGDGGYRIGTPTGAAMGEGSLNLAGTLFHNGQPLVNW